MTIDRAIEILDPEHREHYESIDPVNEACRMGMEALERARWIPCSERPPEELEPVNVVWVNHNPAPYYRYMKDVPQKATAVYYREAWYWWSCVCEDLLAEYGVNETDQVDAATLTVSVAIQLELPSSSKTKLSLAKVVLPPSIRYP